MFSNFPSLFSFDFLRARQVIIPLMPPPLLLILLTLGLLFPLFLLLFHCDLFNNNKLIKSKEDPIKREKFII